MNKISAASTKNPEPQGRSGPSRRRWRGRRRYGRGREAIPWFPLRALSGKGTVYTLCRPSLQDEGGSHAGFGVRRWLERPSPVGEKALESGHALAGGVGPIPQLG